MFKRALSITAVLFLLCGVNAEAASLSKMLGMDEALSIDDDAIIDVGGINPFDLVDGSSSDDGGIQVSVGSGGNSNDSCQPPKYTCGGGIPGGGGGGGDTTITILIDIDIDIDITFNGTFCKPPASACVCR